jgi:hypothetical protein
VSKTRFYPADKEKTNPGLRDAYLETPHTPRRIVTELAKPTPGQRGPAHTKYKNISLRQYTYLILHPFKAVES